MHSQSRLVNETRVIPIVKAGTQANQFPSVIDCTGNITNFTENHARSFFSQDPKETCYLIFVPIIRKDISRKHPICENSTYVCFY